MLTGLETFTPQIICASSDASTAAAAANNSAHTTTLSYPDYSGGHPPLRGSPDYPYGHPGYFNGTHAGQCPGYTGGATDSYGTYSGAGGMAADPNSTTSLHSDTTTTTTLSYPDYSGGHPPLRGSPDYPIGHPGYFNGTHAGQCPGYTGGATDSYGTYSGAGGMAADPNSTTSLHSVNTAENTTTLAPYDKNAPDFVWQRGYSWCESTPNAQSGCASYNAQTTGQVAVLAPLTTADEEQTEPLVPKVPASPGHLMLCGHATLIGMFDATRKVLEGGKVEAWEKDFRHSSSDAAAAVSPVGGYVMKTHVMRTE